MGRRFTREQYRRRQNYGVTAAALDTGTLEASETWNVMVSLAPVGLAIDLRSSPVVIGNGGGGLVPLRGQVIRRCSIILSVEPEPKKLP